MRTEIRSKGQEKKNTLGGKIETIRQGGRCCGERGGMINGGRIVEDYELIIKCKNNVTVCVCVPQLASWQFSLQFTFHPNLCR